MGDPLKSNNPTLPSENTPVGVKDPSVINSVPTPAVESAPVSVAEPSNIPLQQPVAPIPATKPIPVVSEPKPVITNNTASINDDIVPKPSLSKGWRKIAIIILALLVFIIIIIVSVLLLRSGSPAENTVSAPIEYVVSLPSGFVLKDYKGRLYNLDFKYSSELGTATGITSQITYPTDPGVNGDCNLEDVSFSGDRNITVGISTGHCDSGTAVTSDFSKVSSKDGKSFFIVVKKLDESLFPGMYTISASGGIDNSNDFVSSNTGVHIDAIRIKDPDKYKKFIEDIIGTMTIELSPLKSENFDTKSNI